MVEDEDSKTWPPHQCWVGPFWYEQDPLMLRIWLDVHYAKVYGQQASNMHESSNPHNHNVNFADSVLHAL
jgi:hypothetical protein